MAMATNPPQRNPRKIWPSAPRLLALFGGGLGPVLGKKSESGCAPWIEALPNHTRRDEAH